MLCELNIPREKGLNYLQTLETLIRQLCRLRYKQFDYASRAVFHIALFVCLMLRTPGKIFSRQQFEFFFYFSHRTEFDILCKLSPMETVCMKYQILFSGKGKKNITNLLSAKLAQRLVMVKGENVHINM